MILALLLLLVVTALVAVMLTHSGSTSAAERQVGGAPLSAYRRLRWRIPGYATLRARRLPAVAGAAGGLQIADWTGDNVGNAAFLPYRAVMLDVANSTAGKTAVKIPTGLHAQPIGVCYDKSRTDPGTGAVIPNSGIAIRSIGHAEVEVASAVTAGDFVEVANNLGQIATKAQAAAGAQPGPVLGIALTGVAASPGRAIVMLTVGVQY